MKYLIYNTCISRNHVDIVFTVLPGEITTIDLVLYLYVIRLMRDLISLNYVKV